MSLLRRGLVLAGAPFVVFGVMGAALLAEGDASTARSTLAVGVIVVATSGASVIYQVDRWGLPRQTVVHFIVMLCTVLPALLLSGWFALDSLGACLEVVGLFLAAGLTIWLVMFVVVAVVLPRRQAGRREPSPVTRI